MKLSLLLRSLIVPFLMFALLGIDCPGEDDEPDICATFKTSKREVKRLNDGNTGEMEIVTGDARADCSARFIIKFGWDYPERFTSSGAKPPTEESFAGLNFTLGDKNFGKTFKPKIAGPVGDVNPDGKPGFVWFIEFRVSPIASEGGSTRFFVNIEHNVVDFDYNVFVDTTIEYSSE